MEGILHNPGFLGTNANFAADMTLVIMLLIAALFTVGFALAHAEKYTAHRWVQTAGALLNLIMVLWLMVLPFRDFIVRDIGGPRPNIFYTVTTLHAVFGFSAVVFGLFVVLRGNNLMVKPLRFDNYKPYMRVAYALYMLTTLIGVWVYVTWFVTIPVAPAYS
jgi:uncharacterized membrane protein YozB (DUF420 family)